ncbi:MAG: bifunctional UDP-3-O-[3-hydroxymyristoyl] N-acetylglucosamine deacetylase/3-hydroxyacyl-ACP dehydratase [Nitrospiraceae bacterium]|nr:bifunctional UDP-3-O-[3-hydroxymyristoyl] N-acetylglucosamine deacetylase/3-hydroxyacyl-ACP dehydratase [Nitrospiraceae bacterium]
MEKQKTIAEEVSFSGVGLHTGSLTAMTFKPGPPDSGVVFYRVDLPERPAIQADIDHVVDVSRGTTIGLNGAKVHTVEHILAAIYGLDLDNVAIELDGPEIPNGDGSSQPFMRVLKRAGKVEQDAARKYITITEPVYYRADDVTLSVLPADDLRMTMTIAYDHVAVGTQYASFNVTSETFEDELSPARTFCFLREVKMLQERGLIKGGSLESAVVIGDEAILNDELRFPDEFVRHKMLDLLGDMYLLGRRIKGHVIGVKSGHAKNVMFTKQIKSAYLNGHAPAELVSSVAPAAPALDVNRIMRILPHRFPFLLVDRILTSVPHKSAVGFKNVTVNEPFFQGHWPSAPVMPNVLVIEVMAQVSSVLVITDAPDGDKEAAERVAYLTGVDRAKFRRHVVPGDQIMVEAEMLEARGSTSRIRAVAKIDGKVAAEAELTFGLTRETRQS